MAQGRPFTPLSSENDPKRDITKTWQHDMFEPYEALFRADEQQSQGRANHRPAQINFSEVEPNVRANGLHVRKRPTQLYWADLDPNVRATASAHHARTRENLRPAQINLSNLEQNVSNEDLYDLFSLIGNLQHVRLDCDNYGRSEGTASVVFQRKVDAVEAMVRYNGCLLDNKPLNMKLMHSSSETMWPVGNNISKNIAEPHVDVQRVVSHFNSLKLK